MPAVIGDFVSWAGIGIPAFLFVITIVVFFHELGHFAMARAFGVAVQSFSIGFGRELLGWTDRKGTRWKISLLPLGGYVKFMGDADASSRKDDEALREIDPQLRASVLHFKPLYQRALVVAAGPLANFALAIVIFCGLFMLAGKPASPPVVELVATGSAAEAAGLRPGDHIRAVNGRAIVAFTDLQAMVGESAGRPLRLEIVRDGRSMGLDITPKPVEIVDGSGAKHSVGRLGITDAVVPVGPTEGLRLGAAQTWLIVERTMGYLGKLVTGHENPNQLSGPLGIAKISGDMAALGFFALLELAALISVSIGLINLFPIPVLDGGHLLYYGCEAVLGRPLGERAQEVGFRLGLAFVLCLMLLATFNDLVRFNLF